MLNPEQAERLHDLKLRGLAPFQDDELTKALIEQGLLRQRGTFMTLTAEGRQAVEVASLLPEGSEAQATARQAYDAFMPVNAAFLEVCSSWQLKPNGEPNEHDDPGYDWEVRERLEGIHERCRSILRRIEAAVPRFGSYLAEFESALAKLDDGAVEWFTSPRIDSYHTVWMHLHEEFRLALGIAASAEADHG